MAECKVECLHRKQCDAMNNPCWHHTKVISELQQAQATIAAMRETLGKTLYLVIYGTRDRGVEDAAGKALSTTAGTELFKKIDKLERENKALRCCGNCGNITCIQPKSHVCDDWQLAERLVSKGE